MGLVGPRGCVNGTTVHWFAQGEDLVLGFASSQHPVNAQCDGLLLLDLTEGRAYRVGIARDYRQPTPSDIYDEELSPETRSGVRFRDDGFTLRTPEGTDLPVTMSQLRERLRSTGL